MRSQFYLIGILLLFIASSISYSQTIYVPSNTPSSCENECDNVTENYLRYMNCPPPSTFPNFYGCNYCAAGEDWNNSGGWGKACGEIARQNQVSVSWSIYKYEIFNCGGRCNIRDKFYKFTFSTSTCSLDDKYDPNFPGFLRLASPSCQPGSVGHLYKVCCYYNGGVWKVTTTISLDIDGRNPPEGKCPPGAQEVIRYVDEEIARTKPNIYCQNIDSNRTSLIPQEPYATSSPSSGEPRDRKPFIIYKFSTVTIRVKSNIEEPFIGRFWLEIKNPNDKSKLNSPFLYYPRYSSFKLQCFYPIAGTSSLTTYVDEVRNISSQIQVHKKGSPSFNKQVYRYRCYGGNCYECPSELRTPTEIPTVCTITDPAKCEYYLNQRCAGGT